MADSGLKGVEEAWVSVQKKTFTKWMNSHLRKKGFPAIEQAEEEFETGINLMNLINSLYGIEIPKHNKAPKMRPHKLDNISLALNMVEQAQVKTNFLKAVHLADKDLKMILGMIWAIILDFQIKGISVEELTAKEGLLLWCQKKTAGYRDVKVDNFSTSWKDGLAFCALIHRHRPDLLNFDELSKDNAAHNLQLAFDVAEQHLGITPLLDVIDITDSPRPDERSIMTYVSEYFHCFASQDIKEKAARRVQKFVQFNQTIEQMQSDYETQVQGLLDWVEQSQQRMDDRTFTDSYEDAKDLFDAHRSYLCQEKPLQAGKKLDLESLYASIQTKLQVYGRTPYQVPAAFSTEHIDSCWHNLEQSERGRGAAVRDNMYRFITKATSTISEDQLREFEASFAHFDKDGSGFLDRIEFKAALSALSIPFKDEDSFNRLFLTISQGNDKISKDQFMNYMISISEDKDTAEQIKASFQILADQGNNITTQQLRVPPLRDNEIDYLAEKMPAGPQYDYSTYVDQSFS